MEAKGYGSRCNVRSITPECLLAQAQEKSPLGISSSANRINVSH
jgi:hypothetical protein